MYFSIDDENLPYKGVKGKGIVTIVEDPDRVVPQADRVTARMNKFWGLNARTPYRTLLRKDDKAIFSYGAKDSWSIVSSRRVCKCMS